MRKSWLLASSICLPAWCAGEDLMAVYQRALTADPTMQAAEARHVVSRDSRTRALLDMLPLTLSANKTVSGTGGTTTNNSPATAGLSLQFNVFSWDRWIALKQSSKTVAQAESSYLNARQSLIQRVAQRYFAVLQAEDNQASAETALASAERTLTQVERRYEVGLVAVTEVQIARADRDSSRANVLAAKRSLASALEALRAVTGVRHDRLAAPRADMPLLTPDPASEDAWVATALAQNASLISARMAADISHDRYLAAVGSYIPNVSLAATRGWQIQGPQPQPQNDDVTWNLGVSLPLNIGGTELTVRGAKYERVASRADFERSLRETEQDARDNYQGVIIQIAQVQASQQAVESSRLSLAAIEAGYEVGTKTALDVLNARSNLLRVESSYAQAKYSYLNSIVGLRLAAGNLDASTIEQINGWLAERNAPTAATEPVAPAAAP